MYHPTTLVTGGSGLVGSQLLKHLGSAITTTRNPASAAKSLSACQPEMIQWNPAATTFSLAPQRRLHAVVNLMGEPIAGRRWTKQKKKRIMESRVLGTRHLVDGLIQAGNLPGVCISASAVGIYGNCGESIVDEMHIEPFGDSNETTRPKSCSYLQDVCRQWEREANRLLDHGVRVVNLRIGIVLGRTGGALKQLAPLFRWGLGGRLGSGSQWMPWIHIDDLVSLVLWCLDNDQIRGPVNAVAPLPVRNREFTSDLARALHRPAFCHAPSFLLRAVLGEFADSLLASQRIEPGVAIENNFRFKFPSLDDALKDLLA